MPGQNATDPDSTSSSFTFSPQQETAVNLLAIGNTVTETAEKVGATRQTVSGWYNQNFAFRASVYSRRQELFRSQVDRLRSLLVKALSTLDIAMDKGDVNAAVAILKAAGLHNLQSPDGPVTAEEVEIADKERETAKRDRAVFASLRTTVSRP
jgi:hypothetical protein